MRAAAALVLVFVVSSGALMLAGLAPGDFASQFGYDPASIAAERHRLGLDRPVIEQYGRWLVRSLRFDLGDSFQYQRPVTALVRERAANTAILAAAALLLATILGVPGGLLTGSRRGPAVSLVRGASIALLSMPPLITSILLLTIPARTGWLPVGGIGNPPPDASGAERAWTLLRHLVIPAVALALPFAATIERLQAQALREALARPSATAALARGIPRGTIVRRHAWRL